MTYVPADDRYDRWADWRPDPAWPVPVLPSGWDRAEGSCGG